MEDLLKAVKNVDMSKIHESTRNSMLKRGRDDGEPSTTKKQRIANPHEHAAASAAGSSTGVDTS